MRSNPASPEQRPWLTPETFGERLGASESDVPRVVAWLESHDFDVELAAGARRQIITKAPAGSGSQTVTYSVAANS
jgi:subtilase family serine protease